LSKAPGRVSDFAVDLVLDNLPLSAHPPKRERYAHAFNQRLVESLDLTLCGHDGAGVVVRPSRP
jgi:hypothetical protein